MLLSGANIIAQSNNAFYGTYTFATTGANEVAEYTSAPQNGSFTNESRVGLNTSIGEAFSLSSATNITDFELNESGGPSTPTGGYVNFTVTFGTVNTTTGVFTQSSVVTARAVATTTYNSGGPANTFEDFQLTTPIAVSASASGTEYGFIIGENQSQDQADDGGATLNNYNVTSQGYAGTSVNLSNAEAINNGNGDAGTSLNFVVGGTPITVPPAPQNLTPSPGNGTVSLTWSASTGAVSYEVLRSPSSGGTYSELGTTTSTSYTDTGLTNGTTYYYEVLGVNSQGQDGPPCSPVSATPTAGGNSTASIVAQSNNAFYGTYQFATTGSVMLAEYTGAAQNGSFSGESRVGLNTSIGEAFTLSSAATITDFELNEAGGPSTPSGGYVNFTLTFGTLNTSTGVFTGSTTVTARAVGSTTYNSGGPANTFEDFQLSTPISVSASASGTEYGFLVGENQVQDQSDDGGAPLNNNNVTSQGYAGTSVNVSGAEALNNGSGDAGTSLNFVVGGTTGSLSAPGNPSGLGATAGNGQVSLSWTAPTTGGAVSDYEILRSNSSTGTPTQVGTSTSTNYVDTTATNGQTYYYVVTASNNAGTSGYSNQANATPSSGGNSTASIVAQSNNAFFGTYNFATSGSVMLAEYTGAPQNGSFTNESRVGLNTSIGEAFTLSSAATITDFELNEAGGPSTPSGGYVNFTLTFGTLNTSTGVFTGSTTVTARAVGTSTYNSGGPANTFEDFQLATPISVSASAAGTEYGFLLGENQTQDKTDDGGATLNNNNVTSQGYAGTSANVSGAEALNNGSGDAGTSLNFVVGGTTSGLTAPGAPSGLGATGGNNQVSLNWTAPTTGGAVADYEILRSNSSSGTPTQIGTSTTTNYVDTTATNGQTYYYVVTASNNAGTSGYSNQANATPSSGLTAPGAPSGLGATGGNNQVSLSWTAPTTGGAVADYEVLRSNSSTGTPTQIGTSTTTNYVDTTASNGQTYYYVVTASNNAGTSGYSNQANATPSNSVPAAPTNTTSTAGNGQNVLTWSSSSGASSYNVYRSTSINGPWGSPITNTTNTSYTDTGLTNGTTYYYVITAVGGGGQSANSAEVWSTPTSATGNPNYGSIMFLGDSITVGQDSVDPSNGGAYAYGGAGYRGYLMHDLNPVPFPNGTAAPAPGESRFTTVGTLQQGSTYQNAVLGTPGSPNPYEQSEGHSGAKITDLYNPSTGTGFAVTAFGTDGDRPNFVYLMIGSNDDMSTQSAQQANLQNEEALIAYIKSTDTALVRIFVEPPPSYPSETMGDGYNGYDDYALSLQSALQSSPYSGYVTFVDSRFELTDSDFTPESSGAYLHPNDLGYLIIATDFYNASISYLTQYSQGQ